MHLAGPAPTVAMQVPRFCSVLLETQLYLLESGFGVCCSSQKFHAVLQDRYAALQLALDLSTI